MPRHAYDLSLPAFRPSVYSTGLQGSQPYTPGWPQGTEYGYGAWYDWLPPVMAYNYVTGKVAEGTTAAKAAAGAIADTAKSAASSYADLVKEGLATGLSAYQAKLAADEAERQRKAEEEAAAQRALYFKVAGALVLGVGGIVLVQRYRKTGKIL